MGKPDALTPTPSQRERGQPHRSPGQILVVAAVALVVLLGLVGAGVDYGLVLMESHRLQNAADAASLAGTGALVLGPDPGIPAAQATTTEYLRLHGYQTGVGGTTIAFALVTPTPSHTVEIRISRAMSTGFWRTLGIDDFTVGSRATARLTSAGLQDLVLSIPETLAISLADMAQLRDAVAALVDQLMPTTGDPRGAKVAIAQYQGQLCPGDDIWAWGGNTAGQLGDGTTTDRSRPVTVPLASTIALAAGGNHSLAITGASGGTAWAWGSNAFGQLGDGTITNRLSPVAVTPALTGTTMLAGGASHSLGLLSAGTYRVQSWGGNAFGQLGDGTTTDRLSPGAVTPALSNPTMVAGGGVHSLALLSSGTYRVQSWGANAFGQLGNNTTLDSPSPGRVELPGAMVAIAAGGSHSLALWSDGTVWAWGANISGQLGDGTTDNRLAPVQVQGLAGAVAIAAGGDHSLALRSDGTVWAWGANPSGQLGDGTTINRLTPVRVGGISAIIAIAAGGTHSLALEDNGVVWAWGLNASGQLGDGSVITRLDPVRVRNLPAVTAISAGTSHSLALPTVPCLRDAHVLLELANDRGPLFQVINGPSAGCPDFPLQPPSTTPVNPPPSTTFGCPLKTVGGSGRYIKNGFEVAFIPGARRQPSWDLWSTAKGGRANAKKVLILVADGPNQVVGLDQATADSATSAAARDTERGADRRRNTPDDVEIYVVGFFGPGESGLTATTPPGCPSDSVPPGRTDLDAMLIAASSSPPGACDHYYPVARGGNLKAAFNAIGARLTRAQLSG